MAGEAPSGVSPVSIATRRGAAPHHALTDSPLYMSGVT